MKPRPYILLLASLLVALGMLACNIIATPTPRPTPTPTAVPFTTTAFKVNAGTTYPFRVHLPVGARAEYTYNSDLDFNFRVIDPQGNVISSDSRVYSDQGTIRARSGGRHILLFDNTFSVFAPKNITLKYRIVPAHGR